jgi:phospholipid/cholesterol/gamma-HCH transport system substrate-binding protein
MSARAHRLRLAVAALALAGVALILPACSNGPGGGKVITADFARGTGLYPGSPVRILGIDIGRITDVDNVAGRVRVRMQLDEGAKVPAAARATIVPLTLLGERYVQLGPAWRSGPQIADGAHIPSAARRCRPRSTSSCAASRTSWGRSTPTGPATWSPTWPACSTAGART